MKLKERKSHRNEGDGLDFACEMDAKDWASSFLRFLWYNCDGTGTPSPRPGTYSWHNPLEEGFEGSIENARKRVSRISMSRVEDNIYVYPEDAKYLPKDGCRVLEGGTVAWFGRDAVIIWWLAESFDEVETERLYCGQNSN